MSERDAVLVQLAEDITRGHDGDCRLFSDAGKTEHCTCSRRGVFNGNMSALRGAYRAGMLRAANRLEELPAGILSKLGLATAARAIRLEAGDPR